MASNRFRSHPAWFWAGWLVLFWLGTLAFSFLMTPFLRVIWQNKKAKPIYGLLVLASLALTFIEGLEVVSVIVVCCWSVVVCFSWLEDRNPKLLETNFFLATGSITLLGLLWMKLFVPLSFVDLLRKQIDQTSELQWFQMTMGFSLYDLLPGLFYVFNAGNLLFALVLERKAAMILKVPYARTIRPFRFIEYRVKDFWIWWFMGFLLFSFLPQVPVSTRILFANLVLVVANFFVFQGIAVIEYLLYVLRAGLLMRIFVYVVTATYFAMITLGVGLLDYWLDLRGRFFQRQKSG